MSPRSRLSARVQAAGRGGRRLLERLGREEQRGELGDYTTTIRVIPISLAAIPIGLLCACGAVALLRLIGLFTNLFFYSRWNFSMVSPAGNHLGPLVVLVPIAGGLIVGLMARYGSDQIRGHGIPEAIESILMNGSRVAPRLALLKPLSAAIAIGSGGPFGAEGPIIMTGGALGSLIAQFFHLTSAERKTLLVAGAAGGMSATFASPVSAVLLGVEVLLFEWKPRSLIPVALASATAAAARWYVLGPGPLFPAVPHPYVYSPAVLLACILAGLLAGALATLVTQSVYRVEDVFARLPIHWMWWPAIGAVVVGLGGMIFPEALGVGYDLIATLIQGHAAMRLIVGILVVKWLIWAASLGSGTSGGVLAPVLMIGGALGGAEALWFPAAGVGFWPLVSMGAMLGATLRAPLASIVFTFEVTRDGGALLPLLISTGVAYCVTVLTLRRSILTEKIARRGYHLSCEYAIDPLEILFVREVMRTNVAALRADMTLEALALAVKTDHRRSQRLLPVVDAEGLLVGVLTRSDLRRALAEHVNDRATIQLRELARPNPVEAHPDEPLRIVVNRMADTGITRFPVVERDHSESPGLGTGRRLLGIVALSDLLKARAHQLDEEFHREKVLQVRLGFPSEARHES
ncbi:MAG TPA: chloride channel protein [Candidatus Acidoferrales bacterium]|nr:chloride channel protein [Candidatus Acidoferrales bacterium]